MCRFPTQKTLPAAYESGRQQTATDQQYRWDNCQQRSGRHTTSVRKRGRILILCGRRSTGGRGRSSRRACGRAGRGTRSGRSGRTTGHHCTTARLLACYSVVVSIQTIGVATVLVQDGLLLCLLHALPRTRGRHASVRKSRGFLDWLCKVCMDVHLDGVCK